MGNKRIYIASFNRASDGALSKIESTLFDKGMFVDYDELSLADYILAPGDRVETFRFCIQHYGKTPIIHLWAGEVSQGTHDEVYRWAITGMSMMQLCTNEDARRRVVEFCNAVGKEPNAHVVGNVMLDNMPSTYEYDVILYNPPTMLTREEVSNEVNEISDMANPIRFWFPPNGDTHSDIVLPYSNCENLPRPLFLALVKNCKRFISNSSCIDYEVKHIIPEDRIVRVGLRNYDRESIYSDMQIPDATNNVIRLLEEL